MGYRPVLHIAQVFKSSHLNFRDVGLIMKYILSKNMGFVRALPKFHQNYYKVY